MNGEKEVLKLQHEAMIRGALQQQNKNVEPYKKYISIIGSFLVSFILTWCSSGDTSYLPILFKNNEVIRYIICFLPFIAILIFEILVGVSAKGIKKKIDCDFEMTWVSWDKIIKKYILSEWAKEKNVDEIKLADIINDKIKKNIKIVIDEKGFSNYLREYYSKYKLDVYVDFYDHLAKMILLEKEIQEMFSYDGGKYYFIVDDQTKSSLNIAVGI